MPAKNKTSKKFISFFLLISIFVPTVLFFIPTTTSAVVPAKCITADGGVCQGAPSGWLSKIANFLTAGSTASSATSTAGSLAFDAKQWAKEVLEQSLRAIARRTLAKMSESTISWINTGFHGSPLFLENPGSFFKDIAKSEIRNLVNTIGNNSATQPFGKSTAINIINSYKSTFEQNAQYSLSKVTNDTVLLDNFRNDFSVGGWDGFLLQTQFPQNNYLGYNMMVADELVRKTTGKQSAVTDALNQGQGFLSPQSCPSNPSYNNLKNQFQRPTFKSKIPPQLIKDCSKLALDIDDTNPFSTQPYIACLKKNADYQKSLRDEKAAWSKTNDCPGGLVNTTPGSVVADQIKGALGSGRVATELSTAMGSSLSAIFDALLNKLASSGLNALSKKISGTTNTNNDDNFNYYGNTLGTSGSTGTNTGFNWNSPDEVIVLSTFKRDVQNAIDNGNRELQLIYSSSAAGVNELVKSNNGILQVFEDIWPKTAELDMCLPGPNLGWQARVEEEKQKIQVELEVKKNDENASTASAAKQTLDGLESAVASFKAWVANKISVELPGSRNYLSAVNSIKTINEQSEEINKREKVIRETLVKLGSIKSELSTIATEPNPGSAGEATLIRLKQRYDGMLLDLSNSATVSEAQNKLADAKDKLSSLSALLAKCSTERTAKGWSNPGGVDSVSNAPGIIAQTEKSVFCSSYSGGAPVSCEVVFKTEIGDYKK